MNVSSELAFRFVKTNGITLHVVEAGPADGQPMILLHGFPEFWYAWRRQIDALANAGFRLYMPDQRGYNLSDKPDTVEGYNLDALSADIIGLMDAGGHDKVFLVGHDWGGAVAWHLANKYPERLHKLAILNVPHNSVFRKALSTGWSQRRKSWYVAFFQLPRVPEWTLRRADWSLITRALTSSGAFDQADIEKYKEAWNQPGAVQGMLNWYRAARVARPEKLPSSQITVPTHIIWGKQDAVLDYKLAQDSLEYCDEGYLTTIENASHWVQHEASDQVNQILIEWFST